MSIPPAPPSEAAEAEEEEEEDDAVWLSADLFLCELFGSAATTGLKKLEAPFVPEEEEEEEDADEEPVLARPNESISLHSSLAFVICS